MKSEDITLSQVIRESIDLLAVAQIYTAYINRRGSGKFEDEDLIEFAFDDLEALHEEQDRRERERKERQGQEAECGEEGR